MNAHFTDPCGDQRSDILRPDVVTGGKQGLPGKHIFACLSAIRAGFEAGLKLHHTLVEGDVFLQNNRIHARR